MQLRKAERKKVKLKIQIGGPAGSGKTMSALLMAYGMVGDWDKIALIDSENDSAALYVGVKGIGQFQHLTIDDFSPENYVKAINVCKDAGMEAVIIDSTTHCWEWCLDYNDKLPGNSFANWKTTGAKFNKFKNEILQTPMHVIATVRKKEEHVMETEETTGKDGKKKSVTKIVKKGLKEINKSEMSYEYTIVFDVDIDHTATASKDRTALFSEELPFLISEETGKTIKNWAESGASDATLEKEQELMAAIKEINAAESFDQLKASHQKYNEKFKTYPDYTAAVKQKQETFK